MICRSCLRRASSLHPPSNLTARLFSSQNRLLFPSTEATTPIEGKPAQRLAPAFSTPLSSEAVQSKTKATTLPVSICPAGTPMKGLNYFKGKEDPVALKEEEYPEWLWRCLDVRVKEKKEGVTGGDEFSKSKKLRQKAAKAQRKLEAKLLASGDLSSLQPKIPITRQSIDLPSNEEGTLEGALKARERREELKDAMRGERREKIKEANFLKAM